MAYTPDEKRRMDRLVAAFGDFVAQSGEIDVAYSDKTGYIRLIIDDSADAIYFPYHDFDDMLQTFIFDMTNAVVDRLRGASRGRYFSMTSALKEAHRRLWENLQNLGEDTPYALEILERALDQWKKEYMRRL